uniref:hypothetical protein n=1 Tax=Succinimonas sp. TaxID=1936151 RepID=UPI00386BF41E
MSSRNFKPAQRGVFHLKALAAALAMGSFMTAAQAEVMVVEARGKDAATCEVNARLNATRSLMNNMTSRDFLTAHSSEVRKIIIARPQDFTSSYRLLKEDKNGSSITVKAEVDVDTVKLEQTLKSLGAVITKSGELLKRELAASESNALREFFGTEVGARTVSAPVSSQDDPAPVSESVLPGLELE